MFRRHRPGAILLAAVMVAGPTAPQPDPPQDEILVRIETTLGNIDPAIDIRRAPLTAANFLRYVDRGFYDGGMINRLWRLFVMGIPTAFLFVPLSVWVLGKSRAVPESEPDRLPNLSVDQWIRKLTVIAGVYVVLYWGAG